MEKKKTRRKGTLYKSKNLSLYKKADPKVWPFDLRNLTGIGATF